MLPLLSVLSALALSFGLYRFLKRWKASPFSRLSLPPGPKGLPLIGNLLDMPPSFEWEAYHKWSQEFDTDIICLNIAGQNIVVLDTAEAATELLERRSSIYSGRVRMPFINELGGWSFNFGFMDYGETWRQHRRLFHHDFQPAAALQFRPHSLRATRNFLNQMLDLPNELDDNLKHMAGETIMSVAYGIEIEPKDDIYVKTAEGAVKALVAAALPGAFLVDTLPFLKYVPVWMPGAGFQKKALDLKRRADFMINLPFEATKQNIADGKCPPCFTSNCLQRMAEGKTGDDVHKERAIQGTAGTMYAAALDTTSTVVVLAILGLLNRPDILKLAREELDRVIQPGHLPDFNDEPFLPMITAIAKESLRWKEVTPIGIPHYLSVDDEYKGYRIPKNSIVIGNIWAMLHNEDAYPEPFQFKPERFLTKDGQLRKDVLDPAHACYGFGRRICPGRYMAFSALWIAVASLLHAFDIEKAADEDGNILEPNPKFIPSLVCYPEPYPYSIKPRSKEFEELIRANTNLDIL